MTLEEAQKIGLIVGTADSGCTTCIDNLIDRLNASFPEFTWARTSERQYEEYRWGDAPEEISRDKVGYIVAARPA